MKMVCGLSEKKVDQPVIEHRRSTDEVPAENASKDLSYPHKMIKCSVFSSQKKPSNASVRMEK